MPTASAGVQFARVHRAWNRRNRNTLAGICVWHRQVHFKKSLWWMMWLAVHLAVQLETNVHPRLCARVCCTMNLLLASQNICLLLVTKLRLLAQSRKSNAQWDVACLPNSQTGWNRLNDNVPGLCRAQMFCKPTVRWVGGEAPERPLWRDTGQNTVH